MEAAWVLRENCGVLIGTGCDGNELASQSPRVECWLHVQ